jgi:hypothetical protein
MPFGIGLGSIAGLARDVRGADELPEPVRVYGSRAEELARALADGGGPRLVQLGGDPDDACALVCLVGGEPSPGELAWLRRGSRAGVPIIAVRLDGDDRSVPYVLATDVVAWTPGELPPVERVADRLAVRLRRKGSLLARHLPVLRSPLERVLASTVALRGAAFVAVPWGSRVHLPVLSFMQARLLLDLETADGGPVPYTPDEVALSLGPRLGLATAAGLAARTTYRRVPEPFQRVAGPALAYAVTRALAAAAPRLPFPR